MIKQHFHFEIKKTTKNKQNVAHVSLLTYRVRYLGPPHCLTTQSACQSLPLTPAVTHVATARRLCTSPWCLTPKTRHTSHSTATSSRCQRKTRLIVSFLPIINKNFKERKQHDHGDLKERPTCFRKNKQLFRRIWWRFCQH